MKLKRKSSVAFSLKYPVLFVLLMLIIVVGIFYSRTSGEKTISGINSISLYQDKQACDLYDDCALTNCDVVKDCSVQEKDLWAALKVDIVKTGCKKDNSKCDKLQLATLKAMKQGSSSTSTNVGGFEGNINVGTPQNSYNNKTFSKVESTSSCKPTKVSDLEPAFIAKVKSISLELGINYKYLITAMNFETGGTFCSCVKNAAGSGAIGLIQFMPSTRRELKVTADQLCQMSRTEQLDYVRKYFLPFKGKLKTLDDVYLAIFLPSSIGKPADYAIANKYYKQNDGLDKNKDGKITVAEITSKINGQYDTLYG